MRRRVLISVLLLAAAGCLWRSYGNIMAVHLDVLTEMAAKLCTVVEAGRGPTTEGMAEYVYPAQRGREFLRQFRSYKGRRSYQQFGTFLDRYEAMVHEVDEARSQGRLTPTAAAHLRDERDALRALAAQIRLDLEKGS